MEVWLNCLREEDPGEKWAHAFARTWPRYREWYLADGDGARPSYLECREQFVRHFPELTDHYERLCDLSGGGDLASRFLSMYRPPAFMSGCTQVAFERETGALIRNYDYQPRLFEGVLWCTNWLRPVIAVSDCSWGALDGVNESGLCASLTFGGRKVTGEGFGIPLVIRYLLETCDDVPSALEALERIPVHMAYNILLMDAEGRHATVFVGPDRKLGVVDDNVCSNHQEQVDWPEYAEATATVEREATVRALLEDEATNCESLIAAFLQPPLYNTNYERSFGTLYTAAWYPSERALELIWPTRRVRQSFDDFLEQRLKIRLSPHSEEAR